MKRLMRAAAAFVRGDEGGVSTMMLLMFLPLCGMMALGAEASFWYSGKRALQNVADAAALAAATNGKDTLDGNQEPQYKNEALAVAGQYGLKPGTKVQVLPSKVVCPNVVATTTDCYQVQVDLNVPLYLTQVVGYQGDLAINGQRMKKISAVAIARPRANGKQYCMFGLDKTAGVNAIDIRGGPKGNFQGCDFRSNSNLNCAGSGSDTGVGYGDAAGTTNCGSPPRSDQGTLDDPFASLKDYIPPHPCTSPSLQKINSASGFGTAFCGNVQLTGNVNVTSANTVLTIANGTLDLNGFTLSTSGTGSLTIIFTGSNSYTGAVVNHYPTSSQNNKGGIDIKAPSTGNLKGVAIMQDSGVAPDAKHQLDMTYSGSGPSLKVSGLIYFPKGNFQINGAINMHSSSVACLGVVANTVTVKGTGEIFDNAASECGLLNLVLPSIPGAGARQALVN